MLFSKPKSSDDVYSVMKTYVSKKGYSLTESQLQYIAEDMYLYFESRGWGGVKYWPAIAMRWVLNKVNKFGDEIEEKRVNEPKREGPTVRDQILKDVQSENQF